MSCIHELFNQNYNENTFVTFVSNMLPLNTFEPQVQMEEKGRSCAFFRDDKIVKVHNMWAAKC